MQKNDIWLIQVASVRGMLDEIQSQGIVSLSRSCK